MTRGRSTRSLDVGLRASDSHTPPPISALPERRPSSLARAGFMNQARPRPDAIAQAVSVVPAISVETAHITASCRPAGSGVDELRQEGGEEDDRLGLVSATARPRAK